MSTAPLELQSPQTWAESGSPQASSARPRTRAARYRTCDRILVGAGFTVAGAFETGLSFIRLVDITFPLLIVRAAASSAVSDRIGIDRTQRPPRIRDDEYRLQNG